ncbi:hypothetical protein APHAL10511_001231 [Amanita phalloides]|nr:hypothetical protein APHAL10511_001231 [Amanita phalloides]
MPDFRPTRASPPAHRTRIVRHKSPTDLSIRSEQQLKNLRPEEIDFLDAVFERAGPTAVGFMPVFEAYNGVLADRGLAKDEVVGYAKLLKVGNWRGETWREKWREVKGTFGYSSKRGDRPRSSRDFNHTRKFPSSGEHQTKLAPQPPGIEIVASQRHNIPQIPYRMWSPSPSEITTGSRERNVFPHAPVHNRDLGPISAFRSGAGSIASEDNGSPSTAPPSYKTTDKEVLSVARFSGLVQSSRRISIKPSNPVDASAARQVVAAARKRKGSVVNEDAAWKKIQMERDEAEAQRIYQDRLLERFWGTWKNGYEWIIVTGKQLHEARDNLLLRITLQYWRKKLASRQLLHEHAMITLGRKRLKQYFNLWVGRLKLRRQEKWRQDMRMRMKAIQDKQESRIEKYAWAQWRRRYDLHLASQNYNSQLTLAFFKRWKMKLANVDRLNTIAYDAHRLASRRLIIQIWMKWQHALKLLLTEKIVMRRGCMKVMERVVTIWRKRARDFQTAQAFYHFSLVKDSLKSWKTARDRLRRMDDRVNKHVARQDTLLLRAIMRIWKARESGVLLERVINLRCLRERMLTWQRRLEEQKQNENRALQYAMRPRSSVLATAVNSWRQNFITRRNAYSYATQCHSMQLLDRMLLSWRIALRTRLKRAKLARVADKFFATRRTWRIWRFQLENRRREALLKTFELSQLKKWFLGWSQRAQRTRARRISEHTIRDMVVKRLARDALDHWTKAIIKVKLRELEVAQQRDFSVQAIAFGKWKVACIRHAEELSLMESYQYVKREECLRRFLHRWLAATRTARHRRITLKEKEEEIHIVFLAKVWDKWRERFVEEKLRTMERNVVLQNRRNLMFRTFGVWHSKTKSLPALRFHATHVKAKYFAVWRSALPAALQAKKAREAYQSTILSRYMKKWTEMYRAEMAIKAVARARYLRLPTAIPRSTGSTRADTRRMDNLDHESIPSISTFLSRPSSHEGKIASMLRKKRNDTSPARSSISALHQREVSPTRSNTSIATRSTRDVPSTCTSGSKAPVMDGEKRSRLWLELREVQRKNKSLRSRDGA